MFYVNPSLLLTDNVELLEICTTCSLKNGCTHSRGDCRVESQPE